MARARDIEGLKPDDTFAAAAGQIVALRAGELMAQRKRLVRHADATAVHDVRVACRRLRAVLEIFETCFEPKAHRQALRAVKRLASDLGDRRDLDVQRESLGRLAGAASAIDRVGIDSLIAALDADAVVADASVVAALDCVAGADGADGDGDANGAGDGAGDELARVLARLETAVLK